VTFPARRVKFDYGDDFDPAWNPRFPEFACAANSISMLMPYAEPYFVASVRSALSQLDDDLRERSEEYLRQELAHYRQHRRFNDLVVARYPRLLRVEGWMRKIYGRLGRKRSLEFNVAFAAGSETIAYSLARWTEKHLGQLFTGADPIPTTLFLWHLAEEVEHKSAAFDVFEAVDGSRLRYAAATITSLTILFWLTWMSTVVMLAGERRAFYPVTWFRLMVSSLPGHHPRSFVDPVYLPAWLTHFDPTAGTLPLWETPTI
jgi:predicted metal-dependent hydrolase